MLLGETGTYNSWREANISTEVYSGILANIDTMQQNWKFPVLGNCAFAIGAEGTMGDQWNIQDLSYINKYNENVLLCEAMYPALHYFEILLRNHINFTIEKLF